MDSFGGSWERRGNGYLGKELLLGDRESGMSCEFAEDTHGVVGPEGVGCAWLRSEELEDFVAFAR